MHKIDQRELTRDLVRALDPVELARDCFLEPDPWQAGVLRSNSKRLLMLCCRQSGKSTIAAVLAVTTALYDPGLVLILSPSLRQSAEMFRKVLSFWHLLKGVPEATAESALRLELANGSRIVSLPGSGETVRGYSAPRLVIIDEASRVPDELMGAIRPTLATSNGRFVALTTPWGQRGWFHDAWQHGTGYERVSITADECPRISTEFLEQERRELGEFLYQQEYECLFLAPENALFDIEIIQAALTTEVRPLWGIRSQESNSTVG
jgi:hypothetical protein